MIYEMKLSIKHKKFIDGYIKHGNATRAYISAGYSKNKANTNATKLLQNTTIKEAIKQRVEEAQQESLMSVTEALALSASIARGEPQKAYTKRYDHLEGEVDKEVTYTITPNVEERQRSLDHILKVHGAYIDKKEITQRNIEINIGDYDDES